MDPEVHLFILWEKSRFKQNEIIYDINKNFTIVKMFEIKWDNEFFSNNLTRFYGVKLNDFSYKQRECGIGEFLLIVVMDNNPIYKIRHTSKGANIVNVNVFDSKEMYRYWTNGGHKIHATNTLTEANHDLTLLLGLNVADFLNKYTNFDNKNVETINLNIVGHDGWKNIEEIFYVLNNTISYVVLRNYEMLPNSYMVGEHSDIDILTDNYDNIKYITNAKSRFHSKYRVQNIVKIKDDIVQFDFRYIGDGYYDSKWENIILNHKELFNKIIYVPDLKNYFYTLLYHSIIHKEIISKDYIDKLFFLNEKGIFDNELSINGTNEDICNNFLYVLSKFINNNYDFTEPNDLSVYYKNIHSKPISMRRRINNLKKRIKSLIKEILQINGKK